VREYVAILYRGTSYELGRGVRFYGIWPAGRPQPQPIEWWPDSPEGWAGAWARFTGLEPGAITPVGPGAGQAPPPPAPPPWNAPGPAATPAVPAGAVVGQAAPGQAVPGQTAPGQTDLGQADPGYGQAPGYGRPEARGPVFAPPRGYGQPPPPSRSSQLPPPGSRTRALIAAGLLAAGVVLGIVGLFPNYLGGSIASKPDELVPHAIYLAAWTASALLIASGAARQRIGALLGLGVSVVTFGLLAADVATAVSVHAPTGGMWPTLLGWLLATAGAAAGYNRAAAGAPAKPRARETGPLFMLLLAGIGAAVAFAPSWDKFTITASNGATRTITAGNAFANPGLVIAADVLVMVALVAVVAVAALWRPPRLGAALLAGATIPMAAQAISALVQLGEKSPAEQVGLSPGQAAAAGITVTAGPTAVFWVYCIFVGALIACCAWLLLAPAHDQARPAPAWPVPPPGPAPEAARPADDRTLAMAGAPAQATAGSTTLTGTSPAPDATTQPAPVSSTTLADTAAAPAGSPSEEASRGAPPSAGPAFGGGPSGNSGDSPADSVSTQETKNSTEHPADPARPADPAP